METNQKAFFITLTSNTSLDLYPRNTLSKFTAKLPMVLDFKSDNEWYVGIAKFSCTKIEGKINPLTEPTIVFVKGQQDLVTATPKLLAVNSVQEIELIDIITILKQYPNLIEVVENDFFDHYTNNNVVLDKNYATANIVYVLVDKHKCIVPVNREYRMRELFDILFDQIAKEKRYNVVKKLQQSVDNKQIINLDR